MITKKGMFITFEGGEATGKTTQIKKIKKWLNSKKFRYILTREPGGTKISEQLRKIILSSKNKIDINLEVLLIMASRVDHINKVILPALKSNKIVICDRFVDSTAVYQGYYNKFGIENIYKYHKIFLNNLLPDLTFLFKINSKLINKRLTKRRIKNKYDIIDNNFNKLINNGYLKIAKNNKRFISINASLSIDSINEIIIKTINKKLLRTHGIKISKQS